MLKIYNWSTNLTGSNVFKYLIIHHNQMIVNENLVFSLPISVRALNILNIRVNACCFRSAYLSMNAPSMLHILATFPVYWLCVTRGLTMCGRTCVFTSTREQSRRSDCMPMLMAETLWQSYHRGTWTKCKCSSFHHFIQVILYTHI